MRLQGFDVGVFGVVKPSDSPIVVVFPVVKPSESPPAQVFLVVKPSESPSVLVFLVVKPSESPSVLVFLVVKPSESPPFYVFHPVIPSVSPILTCGFVLCACLRRWPLPGDSVAGVGPVWGRSAACLRLLAAAWLSAAAWLLVCARLWAGVGPVDVLGCRRGWAGVVGVGGRCCGLWWWLGGVGVGLLVRPGCLTNECSGVCH